MSKQIELADIELPEQVEKAITENCRNGEFRDTLQKGARLALLALAREPLVLTKKQAEELNDLPFTDEFGGTLWHTRAVVGEFQRRAFLAPPAKTVEDERKALLAAFANSTIGHKKLSTAMFELGRRAEKEAK